MGKWSQREVASLTQNRNKPMGDVELFPYRFYLIEI
jgi:hypothetical protein